MRYEIKQARKFRQSKYVVTPQDDSILATMNFTGYEFRKAQVSVGSQTWEFKAAFSAANISLKRTDKPETANIINPKYYPDGYSLQLGDTDYTLNTNDGSYDKITWYNRKKEAVAKITFKGNFTFTTWASAEVTGSSIKDGNLILLLCLGFFIYRQSPFIFQH